ncbi:MAG: helicase HerA-like domain-containing protein [Candidatus Hermodarchaeota archaeon]
MSNPDFFIAKQEQNRFTMLSTDFLTHAVVLGASGSGKTVICKSIVEEAIRAGIPIIAIDPKGDIGALGIGLDDFSKEKVKLHAKVEAADRGGDAEQIADEWIEVYKKNLEESFGDDFEEIEQDYSQKVAIIFITPKNSAGVQISLTPSFEKPTNYDELMIEFPDAILSSLDLKIQLLLSRSGISGTSSTDNRVIFLNNLIRYIWEEEEEEIVDLAELIEKIQDPPFDTIGSLSVEKFISKTKREELARQINALMVRAIPGVDLDFDKLMGLAKKENKTPIVLFDLRKITEDEERNNFVAEILGEVQRWIWKKGGTSRLRAILYFDELYGFIPAGSYSPPSKTALLILLKQARAAGLGCLLATQNPGDLDYRGLSNIASWFLGRLTTNQDIKKVESALQSVFEAFGGSEEEFKELMKRLRALTPGNFIAYNPKYGVNTISTRWLLSLHKGPLTNEEIKALTLRPPKVQKPKKKIVKSEETIAEKIQEEDIHAQLAAITENLNTNKPSVGKIVERFLIPLIDIQSDQLTQRLFDRFSLTGDPEIDGFTINIGKVQPFYSPIYFARILIKIKRVIKEGSIKFPIELSDEMIRTFDLTKNIQWNSTTVEGIHPASLPPRILVIQPPVGSKFHELSKEFVEKLSANLIWYFTNTPIPEADKIYRNRLREFEQQELKKIAGKKAPKDLSGISREISSLEERIVNEKEKLEKALPRLERLQAEFKAREDKGLSVKAVNRSIESNRAKIERHNEKISELELKLLDAENSRQEMMIEQKSMYDEFHNQIEKLKVKSTPRELYRPSKEDIDIQEEVIYWVPRVIVPVSFQRDETQSSVVVNLNLYNGNGEITCVACGSEISTENYYQTLLIEEISPPIFACIECLNLFCSDHVNFCSQCGNPSCLDHSLECSICGKGTCSSCPSICTGCGQAFCEEHLFTCKGCEAWVCSTCGRVKAKVKDKEFIARCVNCS